VLIPLVLTSFAEGMEDQHYGGEHEAHAEYRGPRRTSGLGLHAPAPGTVPGCCKLAGALLVDLVVDAFAAP
jgi:hypothetical protein